MRKTTRMFLIVLSLLTAVTTGAGLALAATPPPPDVIALIMGGTGRPNPDDFPGYPENVRTYYIQPNSSCLAGATCKSVSVFTPETAWPLYGGLDAPTWKNSILQGVDLFDTALKQQIDANPGAKFVLFGYSQSGEIVGIEKSALPGIAADKGLDLTDFQIVAIGNPSRPNGGIDTRLPFSIPIVDFPYGPAMPTDTGVQTTDIAFKWDIIADAPTFLLNPLAWVNALLGFEYVHGTMPDPTAASPDSTPGGYSVEDWQAIMDDPDAFAASFPDLVNVQQFGDTKYVTVTPTVLPIVMPLHQLGLTPLADLLEPALRVLIEETGYDRTIPYGQVTPIQLIPNTNLLKLAVDLIPAVIQGVQNFINDLTPAASSLSVPALNKPQVKALQAPKQDAQVSLTKTDDTSKLMSVTADLAPADKLSNPPAAKLAPKRPLLSALSAASGRPQWRPGNLFRPGKTAPADAPKGKPATGTATTTGGTTAPTNNDPPPSTGAPNNASPGASAAA